MGKEGDTPSFLNDRVNSQGEENRAEGVALSYSSSAGYHLRGSIISTREESAVVAITAVYPWRKRREMCANGLNHN